MRLVVSMLLSGLLAAALGYWLRGQWRHTSPGLRRWLLPALGWRLLLTAISTSFPSPDAQGMATLSQALTAGFWAQPAAALTLWQGNEFHIAGKVVTLYAWSNTLYFIKLLALANLATGGSLWLAGLYLSLLCFVGCWSLVRALAQVFPLASVGAAGVAFLAWPSVVWWTAGLTKETLVVGAGAGVVALVLPLLYGDRAARPWPTAARVALSLLLAWVMFRMRYFFALPLLGGLLALALGRLATRRGWLGPGWGPQVGGLLAGLALVAGPISIGGSKVVSTRFLVDEIDRNYQHGLLASPGRPHLEYADWQPTPLGLLRHAPAAAAQALVRPWLGESRQPLYLAAGCENLLLLGLLGLAMVAAWRGRAGRLPAALVALLLFYCLALAIFIGLSTPNLGTLHRYRAALLPWLLLLLLQNDYARGVMKKLE